MVGAGWVVGAKAAAAAAMRTVGWEAAAVAMMGADLVLAVMGCGSLEWVGASHHVWA